MKTVYRNEQLKSDTQKTLKNRVKLLSNTNLCTWYRKLYKHKFRNIRTDFENKKILEIGSGTSPLKLIYPHVMTNDIMKLNYIDYVFDCHEIDSVTEIRDYSIDVITFTNVLHHLKNPVEFLIKASTKLTDSGIIIATEPFFSVISTFIYKYIHHESVDLEIKQPLLTDPVGPLSSANIALPYLIFFSENDWCEPLWKYYSSDELEISYFSSLSYMLTGGIAHRLPFPGILFNRILKFDLYISQLFPKIAASFFTVILKKNSFS